MRALALVLGSASLLAGAVVACSNVSTSAPDSASDPAPEHADAGPAIGYGKLAFHRSFSSPPPTTLVAGIGGGLAWPSDLIYGPRDYACTQTIVSACTVRRCTWTALPEPGDLDYDAGPHDPAPPQNRPEAGRLTISGATPAVLTLDPVPDFHRYETQVAVPWTGGTPLRVQAAGGVAPPFDLTIVAPSMIKVIAPVARPGLDSAPRIDSTKDLVTRWELVAGEAASGSVVFLIDWVLPGHDRKKQSMTTTCTFEVTARTGVVPAQALASFPKGLVAMGFSTEAKTRQRVGGWEIELVALGEAEPVDPLSDGHGIIE